MRSKNTDGKKQSIDYLQILVIDWDYYGEAISSNELLSYIDLLIRAVAETWKPCVSVFPWKLLGAIVGMVLYHPMQMVQ